MFRSFWGTYLVAIIGLTVAFFRGGAAGASTAAILAIMEVSLSFDNAVMNATKLKDMSEYWRKWFMTWGMLIAVFGMRLVFPVLIVSVVSGLGLADVAKLAMTDTTAYGQHLTEAHTSISAFGGMFLLMVFLKFVFDSEKDVHWFHWIEEKLSKYATSDSISILVSLIVLVIAYNFVPKAHQIDALVAGISGLILFEVVDMLASGVEAYAENAGKEVKNAGFIGVLYLEILDASFSFDGVIGAFAISKDIFIIMVGLAIGAMAVRSMTIHLVRKGTLQEYIYLEHGAHYAVAVLALIMLTSMVVPVPELITGLTGVAFIGLSVWSSIRYKKAQALTESGQ